MDFTETLTAGFILIPFATIWWSIMAPKCKCKCGDCK